MRSEQFFTSKYMKSHSLTAINCGICLCTKACYGTFQTEARLFMSFQELSYN